jgi:hypothetical protein
MTRPYKACNYIEFDNKKYLYLNDDSPVLAYQNSDVAFVAQPLPHPSNQFKVIPVPLMMTDEWDIIKDNPQVINDIRTHGIKNRAFDFSFVGQCQYVGREVFRNINLNNYDFEETSPVYHLSKDEKKKKLVDFLYRISTSRFTFAPRGVGSSSFRAYQAMMVGSIPIITEMNDYPFKNEVDWDSICIRGDLRDLVSLVQKAISMSKEEYDVMRNGAMSFWDKYCKHDNLFNKLKELV